MEDSGNGRVVLLGGPVTGEERRPRRGVGDVIGNPGDGGR